MDFKLNKMTTQEAILFILLIIVTTIAINMYFKYSQVKKHLFNFLRSTQPKIKEWKQTNQLRWYSIDERVPPILQQAWKNCDGMIIWRGVEKVKKNKR